MAGVKTILFVSIISLLSCTSCYSDGAGFSVFSLEKKSEVKKISYEEASSFERKLKESYVPSKQKLFMDFPSITLDKQNNCRIQLPNYLIFNIADFFKGNIPKDLNIVWDGKCENNQAVGIGRLVVFKDYYHSETIINISENVNKSAPLVHYDFSNNKLSFVKPSKTDNKIYVSSEEIILHPSFDVNYSSQIHDEVLNSRMLTTSLFNTINSVAIQENNVIWLNIDTTAQPVVDPLIPNNKIMILDARSNHIGFEIDILPDDTGASFIIDENSKRTQVSAPKKYLDEIFNKILANLGLYQDVSFRTAEAINLNRIYKLSKCKANGLKKFGNDDNTICTWGIKYKSNMEKALQESMKKTEYLLTIAKENKQRQLLEDRIRNQKQMLEDVRKLNMVKNTVKSILDICISSYVGL